MNRYLTQHKEEFCCGCNACVEKCPVRCIEMQKDDNGFIFPRLTEPEKCINCGLCSKVCPFEDTDSNNTAEFYAVAGYTNDAEILSKSSSGGIFTELAKLFFDDGGAVFGASLDSEHKLSHICVDSVNDLHKIQGSKYIQSSTNGVFSKCKQELENGRKVLFSGTPCQISGLRKFLGKEYENLYTADVICHGVPSEKMFEAYVDYLEKKHNAKLVDICFRDKKKNGWSITLKYTMEYKNGRKKDYRLISPMSEYFTGFLGGYISRESCYVCPFSSLDRPSDITMGDFWGYQKTRPELANDKGLSLLLVNTEKGKALLERLKEQGLFFSTVSEDSVSKSENKNLYKPTHRPPERTEIYSELEKHGFEYISGKYLRKHFTFKNRVKNAIPKRYWKFL